MLAYVSASWGRDAAEVSSMGSFEYMVDSLSVGSRLSLVAGEVSGGQGFLSGFDVPAWVCGEVPLS